jgi:uncharacterized phage protein gp47/JayE
MSSTAATISATGISAPTYAEILTFLKTQYLGIFGADADLDDDTQDGQLLAVFALALSDANIACIAAYNSFSPATAQGTGLSSNVKINGLKRLVPSYSTATVSVGGVANITTITNGAGVDTNGNIWALPTSVTIPSAGTIDVIATCTEAGAITAAIGAINSIQTPTYGWQSITNAAAAAVGAPVETDAALRIRQSQSVALPSQTIFAGIVASLEALPGVTRVAGIENNTSGADAQGIPANSLAFVVEGGVESAIQNAIFLKITPGIPTFGSISATLTDANGSTRLINYSTPTDATISVAITLRALSGWSSSTQPLIAAALVAFLADLPIGAGVSYFGLIVPASLLGTAYAGTFAITGMTLQKNALSPVSADIELAYNEAAVAAPSNVSFVT